ncbi:3-hydroxyacyl-CoA dehydrogenase [Raineyella antarctica]|uniref:L-gulonate 3-dehydrogenase n=1 Tax=Raineyella antarctica TaxID=1577474 RepID=A0A1G6GJ06_9ACTN|nr:3-hydroxyacyl-CoA dehydrogenase NAD-binding domain-containing protein [Raineyella antarctica]SDB82002.1 3-hydroxyacyl-CoA dehydrogenase [Raineyella antarctica]
MTGASPLSGSSPTTGWAPTVAVGAGRMGRGIAVAYALKGRPVTVLDFKARAEHDVERLVRDVQDEVRSTLDQLATLDVLSPAEVEATAALVTVAPLEASPEVLGTARIVYEGVPETPAAKADALPRLGLLAAEDTIIASTTSTMLASELAGLVPRTERFLNAHWLNPAFINLLVEVSPHEDTDPRVTEALKAELELVGKVPVVCACSPGFIVPRLQALIMNEAARMVSEGVATAADIDKATRFGLGLRFASLGVLEFIDFGGNDILYYADRYLSRTIDEYRYAVPAVIEQNMREGRDGLRTGQGFFSYDAEDVDAYRQDVLRRTLEMARHFEAVRDSGS